LNPNYARTRASFRSGEIHVLDPSGNVERTICFTEADRKLWRARFAFTMKQAMWLRRTSTRASSKSG